MKVARDRTIITSDLDHPSTALQKLASVGAVITNSHFVYASGEHGATYINKDAVYPYTHLTAELCGNIAQHFVRRGVEAVIAPAVGGVILSTWVANHLDCFTTEQGVEEVLGLYADKENGQFVIRRGYDKLVPGRKVLVVEDILTTGGSVKKVVQAVRALSGEVVGVGVLCNRGGITAADLADVPEIFALVNVNLDSYAEDECPLCAQGVPINTDFGNGRDFLARQQA